jgi:hypothetical protein
MTWVVAGSGIIYPFMAGDVRVTFRQPDGSTSERDCLQKIHRVARNILGGFAGSVRAGLTLLDAIQRRLHEDHWYSLPELTYQRYWLPRLMHRVFGTLPEYEQALRSEVVLLGAHPRFTRGALRIARCHTIRFRSPAFEPEETTGAECVGIGSGDAVGRYRDAAREASASDALVQMTVAGLQAPAQFMASVLHRTVTEGPEPGVSPHFLYATVSPAELVIRPWEYEERGAMGHRYHRVPPLVRDYGEFIRFCCAAGLLPDAAVALHAPVSARRLSVGCSERCE